MFSGKADCQAAVSAMTVSLERKLAGESNFTKIAEHATDGNFNYSLSDAPSRSGDYKVVFAPGSQDICTAGASPLMHVGVRPGIVFNNVWNTSPRAGQSTAFGGKLLPAHPGRRVILQVLGSDGWHNVTAATLDRYSNYGFSYRLGGRGSRVFRVIFQTQDADHLWNVSRNLRVTWS